LNVPIPRTGMAEYAIKLLVVIPSANRHEEQYGLVLHSASIVGSSMLRFSVSAVMLLSDSRHNAYV